jgi:hypothetical protein
MYKNRVNLKITTILILALFLRLLGIMSRPIWYDEAFSILFAEKGLDAMLYGTLAPTGAGSADIHPLGYYTLLSVWMRLFGELISVYLIYLIALEALPDRRTAYLSMLIAATAPFQIHYAQEIRMYSLLGMCLLLATYAYQRGSKTKNWKWWLVFSLAAASAQYTHNLAAFYLVPLALSPLFQKDWKTLQAVILASFGAVILYLPWLVELPAQLAKVQQSYWVERPDLSKFFTLVLVYMTNTPLPDYFIPAALLIVLTVISIGLVQTVRASRQTNARGGLWFLYLSFGPPLLLFLFSQWRPVYIERALLASGAMFCIWLAWVSSKTNLPYAAQYSLLGLLVISFILGIYQHITYRDFPYGPFKELDMSLQQRLRPGDIIIHSNKLTLLPALYYDPNLSQTFIGDPKGSRSDTLASATQEVLGIQAKTDIQTATRGAERVWYIIFQRALDEYGTDQPSSHPDLEYLNSHYALTLQESWDGLQVYLYSGKP